MHPDLYPGCMSRPKEGGGAEGCLVQGQHTRRVGGRVSGVEDRELFFSLCEKPH